MVQGHGVNLLSVRASVQSRKPRQERTVLTYSCSPSGVANRMGRSLGDQISVLAITVLCPHVCLCPHSLNAGDRGRNATNIPILIFSEGVVRIRYERIKFHSYLKGYCLLNSLKENHSENFLHPRRA